MNTMNNFIPACNLCNGNCNGCFYADFCPSWLDTGTDVYYIPDPSNPPTAE